MYGYFPAIRYALRSRGWVEKILHQVPYVNPHPANCVCFQAHCSNSSPPVKSQSNPVNQSQLSSKAKKSPNFIQKNKELCKSSSVSKPSSTEDTTEEERHEDINMTSDEKYTKEDNDEENKSLDCINNSKNDDNDGADEHESMDKTDKPENNSDIKNESQKIEPKKFEFNPSILCPAEIRNGIENCITENNECLYQYTVPVYEKPEPPPMKRTESSDRNNLLNDISTDCNGEESSTCDSRKEHEEDEEQDQEDEMIEQEESSQDYYDPLNPYPDLDFKIDDIDASLVGRLLKNAEPNLIWTWTKDSVSYKHLTKDQMVNRFPCTPFTTKVQIAY